MQYAVHDLGAAFGGVVAEPIGEVVSVLALRCEIQGADGDARRGEVGSDRGRGSASILITIHERHDGPSDEGLRPAAVPGLGARDGGRR